MKSIILIKLCAFIVIMHAQAQPSPLQYHLEARHGKIRDIPVSLRVSPEVFHESEQFSLYEVKGDSKTLIPFQVDAGNPSSIWFIPPPHEVESDTDRFFLLEEKAAFSHYDKVTVSRIDSTLRLIVGNISVLEYQSGIVEAPPGTDTLYRRSGFIHPLKSPGGAVLTAIQPDSHIIIMVYGIPGPGA